MPRFFLTMGRAALAGLFCLAALAQARPVVVFMSDFGLENEAAGLCHGAMLRVDADLQIIDLTHGVRPYDIEGGARVLKRATTFPAGTVFVGVVDPGVGTAREPIAVKTKAGFYYIAPNNGLLTEVLRAQGLAEARRIEPKLVNPAWSPGTFDGRDLFSPAAAMLAASGGKLEALGPVLAESQLLRLNLARATVDAGARKAIGKYIRTDEPYGNVWTNIEPEEMAAIGLRPGMTLLARIAGRPPMRIPFVIAFGDVPEGKPLAYINSDGRLGLALNMGDMRKAWGLKEGAVVSVQAASAETGSAASPTATPTASATATPAPAISRTSPTLERRRGAFADDATGGGERSDWGGARRPGLRGARRR